MADNQVAPRSPELMSRHDTALLVVDVQTKLLHAMSPPPTLVWNIGRLIDGAHILGIPVEATEQYPQGLGTTTRVLAQRLDDIPSKVMFSCRECGQLFERCEIAASIRSSLPASRHMYVSSRPYWTCWRPGFKCI